MISNETRLIDMTAGQLRELFREFQIPKTPPPTLLSLKKKIGTDELCSLYGFAKSTVYLWVSERFIPHSKPRKRLQFDVDEINSWIDSYKIKTKAEYLR